MINIEYFIGKASLNEVMLHLQDVDKSFTPTLRSVVNLESFTKKIYNNTIRFEAWHNQKLVGLLSAYFNNHTTKNGFINHIAIEKFYQSQGISKNLIARCIEYAINNGFESITLEVSKDNHIARNLYENFGFLASDEQNAKVQMKTELTRRKTMPRNYNKEIIDNARKYGYSFDFDVMHPFMIRSFEPFFNQNGNMLELGCFKGDFTKRFTKYFTDITCIEASSDAITEAKQKLPSSVKFIHGLFEEVTLTEKYDNIIFTHVLEHLDAPVKVLQKINNEWLSDNGKLFLVTPNAMAPSRQIAVKMGLITHNTAITKAEKDHGHRITYTLDTLERDVKAAGLNVIFRSGIFFKALANFQWDQLLQTDIISKKYLEGCYELGQQYPELCSSIFLMCEKSK